ncbi:MAG: hypothetical protein NXI14_04150 [bacterium]|nr:hypothetical protein [bacterium]
MLPHRFKHYQRNIGWRTTIINLIIVGYLLYVMFGGGIDPARLILAGMMVAGAFAPRLFLNRMVANPQRTTKILNYCAFVVMGVFILNFAGIWSPPVLLAILIPPLVGIIIGGNFWLFSDPRILTDAGVAHYTAYHAQARSGASRTHHETSDRDNPTPLAR